MNHSQNVEVDCGKDSVILAVGQQKMRNSKKGKNNNNRIIK